MSDDRRSESVERTLARPELHETWEDAYRTDANERFYEVAFDALVEAVGAPAGSNALDVGCGSGAHAIRLARRGFVVHAVDFSESALAAAAENVPHSGLSDRITLGRENLLELSFADETFDLVLCWGVLMHVPEVDRAVAELARVVRRQGIIVVSEANMRSAQVFVLRALRLALRRGLVPKRTPAGLEYWRQSAAGPFLTRQADMAWLIDAFARAGSYSSEGRRGS